MVAVNGERLRKTAHTNDTMQDGVPALLTFIVVLISRFVLSTEHFSMFACVCYVCVT